MLDLEPAPFTPDAETEIVCALVAGVPIPDEHAAWQITGTGSAEWAMHRYAELAARIGAAETQAADWRARIAEWLADTTRADRAFASFLQGHLEAYGIAQRRPKATVTKLPSGEITTRHTQARPVIANDEAVVEWLEALDATPEGAIKRTPLVSKFKDLVVIAEVATGRTIIQVACCGAWLTREEDMDTGTGLSGTVLCSNCGAEGEVISSASELAPAPVYPPTGEVIPGLTVEPEHTTATVKPFTP